MSDGRFLLQEIQKFRGNRHHDSLHITRADRLPAASRIESNLVVRRNHCNTENL
jgi:hypothetical protein